MNKNILLLVTMMLSFGAHVLAQTETPSLYNPMSNAQEDLNKAYTQAKRENKHVLVQAGGNWCKWCLEFHRFRLADKSIDSLIQANYVVYHLNYSKENKNEEIFASLGFPQRFGFPVFLIIDGNGKLLHTENSVYLEEGKSYSAAKTFQFLKSWTPAAIDPKTYQKK